MTLEILCAPIFPENEDADLHKTASELGVTTEVLIRNAVRTFVSQCVPTQKAEPCGDMVSLAECVPTH